MNKSLNNYYTKSVEQLTVFWLNQDAGEYPLLVPLPSYGEGRDGPGGRFSSLIGGSHLNDVVVTGTFSFFLIFHNIFSTCIRAYLSSLILRQHIVEGDNGTIDGQGSIWWKKFNKKKLKNTRPYLIELMYANQVQISNLTLIDSPSWFVHPVYSRSTHLNTFV